VGQARGGGARRPRGRMAELHRRTGARAMRLPRPFAHLKREITEEMGGGMAVGWRSDLREEVQDAKESEA